MMLLTSLLTRLEPRSLAITAAAVVCGLIVIALAKSAYLPKQMNYVISKVLHVSQLGLSRPRCWEISAGLLFLKDWRVDSSSQLYLCRKYPINDFSGRHPIPTMPYTWPSGQGDIGKFLEGIENSVSWEKTHGQIYRIWSGMRSEV